MSVPIPKPSPKTVKLLFAKSGNMCAYPRCDVPMASGSSVSGQIAHIRAESPGGPRFDLGQSPDERRSYENLILLCGVHHKAVDDAPEIFTVEALTEMKRRHEASIREIQDPSEIESAAGLLIERDVNVSAANLQNAMVAGVIQNSTIHNNYGPTHTAPVATESSGWKTPQQGLGRFRAKDKALGRAVAGNPFVQQQGPEIFLKEGSSFWVRLRAQQPPVEEFNFEQLKSATDRGMLLSSSVHGSIEARLQAADGIGHFTGQSETYGVNMLFRNGEIWSIDSALVFQPVNQQRLFALRKLCAGG